MAFLIRSDDGRISICTSSAEAAAGHVARLQGLGRGVAITDVNGQVYDLGGLHRHGITVQTAPTFVAVVA